MSETPELPPLPNPVYGGFPEYDEEQMRQFWEAGRRAGLEEAAKLAGEQEGGGDPGDRGYDSACADCERAIRAECGGTGRAKP